jgi:photosystem II stability/assembly factor-like uncharacterized protein
MRTALNGNIDRFHFLVSVEYPEVRPGEGGFMPLSKVVVVIGLVVCLSLPGLAEWVNLQGPEGGNIQAIAVKPNDPKIILTGGSAGLFRSTDEGSSWIVVKGLEGFACYDLAFDPNKPNIGYAACESELYRTDDAGVNWQGLSVPTDSGSLISVAVNSAGTIFAAGEYNTGSAYVPAVYISKDSGDTWSPFQFSADTGYILTVVCDPANPDIAYAGGLTRWTSHTGTVITGFIYKSTDEGDNWSVVEEFPDEELVALVIDPINPQTLYTSTWRKVFKSTDGGESWTDLGTNFDFIETLAIDPFNHNTLFAGCYTGVFKSTDGGTSWSPINTGFETKEILSLATDPTTSSTIYAGTNGDGIYKSTNGGTSWSEINQGLWGTCLWCIAATSPATIYTGGYGGVFKSSDGGANWQQLPYEIGDAYYKMVRSLAIDPDNSQILYMVDEEVNNIYKTTDGGTNWQNLKLKDSLPNVFSLEFVTVDPKKPSNVYVVGQYDVTGTVSALFKSTDGGNSWKETTIDPEASIARVLAIDPVNPSVLYTGCNYYLFLQPNIRRFGRIYKSTDGGDTWEMVFEKEDYIFRSIAIDPKNPQTVYAGYGSGIYKSTDGGTNWQELTADRGLAITIDPATQTIYAAGYAKVIKSTDGGATWQDMNQGLPVGVMALSLVAQTLFGATYGLGVYRNDLGGVAERPALPEQPLALQIVPNPFSEKTLINYQLPIACKISLKIYDASGQLISTLVEGRSQKLGTYKVSWDSRKASSGLYFLRLDAGFYKVTKKLTLVR